MGDSSPEETALGAEQPRRYVPPFLRRTRSQGNAQQQPPASQQRSQQKSSSRQSEAQSESRPPSAIERVRDISVLASDDQHGGKDNEGATAKSSWDHTKSSVRSWQARDGRKPQREEAVEKLFLSSKDKVPGINFDSYDNIDVELSGTGSESIKIIDSFLKAAEILPDVLVENIKRVNYEKPTPVQKYSIPCILSKRDLMSCAQTGSGKTAAFLFPMIILMMNEGPPATAPCYPKRCHPVGLVLSPTRELAIQIYEEARKFSFHTGIRARVVYGGSDMRIQLLELDKGCDICIATPGRLMDVMLRGRLKLSQCSYFVLDEADRMLDMGFAPQIQSIVTDHDLPQDRQTVMFSATFPQTIQHLARDFMKDYLFLTVGRVGSTSELVQQKLVYADEMAKPDRLLKLLRGSDGLVLIFVETKRKADVIEDFLRSHDLSAVSIHGDKSQSERERALQLFRTGKCSILVATDVAARGLDIANVNHVINCDLPNNIEDYVHRIGRTGRAGNTGIATSFVHHQNKPVLRDLLATLHESNQEVPAWFHDLVRESSSISMPSSRSNNRYSRGGAGVRSRFGARDARFDGGSDRFGDRHGGERSADRQASGPSDRFGDRQTGFGGRNLMDSNARTLSYPKRARNDDDDGW